MEHKIAGAAGALHGWVALPPPESHDSHGVVIVPGFPTDPGGGANSFATYPDLADRIAEQARMTALTVAFRGLDRSVGNFSLGGWQEDLLTAIAHVRTLEQVKHVWLIGFGTGGALAVDAAATAGDVRGVISIAAPADFQDWASRPRELLSHARQCGAISDPDFPEDFGKWAKELQRVSTVKSAEAIGERTLMLVIHGSNDDAVPALDARAIADAHGSAGLRIIDGARHHLRHDPRAIAIAIGWLSRRGLAA